jgi:hypothetical protein
MFTPVRAANHIGKQNGEMPDHAAAAIKESVRLVDELSTQLRTISHLPQDQGRARLLV